MCTSLVDPFVSHDSSTVKGQVQGFITSSYWREWKADMKKHDTKGKLCCFHIFCELSHECTSRGRTQEFPNLTTTQHHHQKIKPEPACLSTTTQDKTYKTYEKNYRKSKAFPHSLWLSTAPPTPHITGSQVIRLTSRLFKVTSTLSTHLTLSAS